MLLLDIVLSGLVLGGMYALTSMGLTLQYGVARIMNLAYGEFLVAAAFVAFWLYTEAENEPARRAHLLAVPLAFVANWAIYRWLLTPLVNRAKSRGQLEVDSILATFGLLFIVQGIALVMFGGQYYSYSYLSVPVSILGVPLALNRLLALALAVLIAVGLYLALTRTRTGTAIRAVAVDPNAARLVAIDVATASAFAFALGGALVAAGGVLVSMFLTFNAAMGVVFTMKALIVVIVGGARQHHGRAGRRAAAGHHRDGRVAAARSGPDAGGDLRAVHDRPAGAAHGAVREPRAVSFASHPCRGARGPWLRWCWPGLPLFASGYVLALAISMLSFTTLATAWALFSGPTHYISLASAAFFGLGAYAAAMFAEQVPWPVVLLLALLSRPCAWRLSSGSRR